MLGKDTKVRRPAPVSKQRRNNSTPAVPVRRPRAKSKTPRHLRPLAGLDTETTGLDFKHGCKPYYVSIFTSNDESFEWLWEVNPFTRVPVIPPDDVRDIQRVLDRLNNEQYLFVIQNCKVDVEALQSIGIIPPAFEDIEDPLVAHHLLASDEPHGLKEACLRYLGIDDDDEDAVLKELKVALPMARKLGWDVKRVDPKTKKTVKHPHFPCHDWSEKQDAWVLRALAKHYRYPKTHKWWNLTSNYGMNDAVRAVGIWWVFKEAIDEECLEDTYRVRMDLAKSLYTAEQVGMTLNQDRLDELHAKFQAALDKVTTELDSITPPTFKNPRSSPQIAKLLYDEWECPIVHRTRKGNPGTDSKVTIKKLKEVLHYECRAFKFLETLEEFRHLDNSLGSIERYRRGAFKVIPGWLRLHTTINHTGTKTTRLSTSNPSQQNVSKQKLYNLRYAFGPLPGREWYSIDQSNVEMRIFAYCSGDEKLIKAFEDGYAVHLIFAEILYPREFEQCLKDGVSFKDRYESTLYQWIKNGNFALIYGAGEEKANATYRLPGAYSLIRQHLPLVDDFIRSKYAEGQANGYVELLGGYRLQVPSSEPHKAANYFVQGSAGWAIQVAMNRIHAYLREVSGYDDYTAYVRDRAAYHMILQVHDELDFDFPAASPDINYPIIRNVAKLMMLSGDEIGIPLPVEINKHPVCWSEKEHLSLAA